MYKFFTTFWLFVFFAGCSKVNTFSIGEKDKIETKFDNPSLKLSIDSKDYGEVAIDDSSVEVFTIKNETTSAVTLVEVSNEGLGIEPPFELASSTTCESKQVLLANETCEIHISFLPTDVSEFEDIAIIEFQNQNEFSSIDIAVSGTGYIPDEIAPVDNAADPQFLEGFSTDGNNINISWTGFSDNVGIASHRIKLYTDSDCTTSETDLGLVSGTDTTTTLNGIDNGIYHATITAYDAAGNSTTSNCSSDFIVIMEPFVTNWKTDNTGVSQSDEIQLPLEELGSYKFYVDWGDGQTSTITAWVQSDALHEYNSDGVYTIKIYGKMTHFRFKNLGDKDKILLVTQWGDNVWENVVKMFYGCGNINISATDAPDLSQATSLSYMFRDATLFNSNIGHWDTSNITNMVRAFQDATNFDSDLSGWDVSSVTSMKNMFNGASNFNQSIGAWDTSEVTDMSYMFHGASNFNQNINTWDTSKVTEMNSMFQNASNFNSPIGSWNTSEVVRMHNMFNGATVFNQDINTTTVGGHKSWDVSKVFNMSMMFNNATAFNQPLNDWNTLSLTTMYNMFYGATAFNQDLDNWTTTLVEDMGELFRNAINFNGNISTWNVSNVLYMDSMFQNAEKFNSDISSWDTSAVTTMYYMFMSADIFNQNISTWNVSSVNNMQAMFYNASDFNQNISGWNTGNLQIMKYMFRNSVSFDQDLSSWDVGNVSDSTDYDVGATLWTDPAKKPF